MRALASKEVCHKHDWRVLPLARNATEDFRLGSAGAEFRAVRALGDHEREHREVIPEPKAGLLPTRSC
jgi:hypothetical protein